MVFSRLRSDARAWRARAMAAQPFTVCEKSIGGSRSAGLQACITAAEQP
jgi:hypothetical protein